jgi:hypothetical protein
MSDNLWWPVDRALNAAGDAGGIVEVWLRDDDAVTVTPALDRLTELCDQYGMPILLAVIPEPADEKLSTFVGIHPLLTPTQHGFNHTNHALPGQRARELGGGRPIAAVISDLQRGLEKLSGLFGSRMTAILVPPWNRIDDDLLPLLPGLGFQAISTFGARQERAPGLAAINCDLDIIDWKNGRRCHPHEKLARRLADLVAAGEGSRHSIGLLTHHLAHDEEAWIFLDACFARLQRHAAVRFITAEQLLRSRISRQRADALLSPS